MNLCACGSEKSISLKPVPFLVSTVAIVWRKLLHAKVKLDQAGKIPLSTEIYFYLWSFTCLLLNAVMIFQFDPLEGRFFALSLYLCWLLVWDFHRVACRISFGNSDCFSISRKESVVPKLGVEPFCECRPVISSLQETCSDFAEAWSYLAQHLQLLQFGRIKDSPVAAETLRTTAVNME